METLTDEQKVQSETSLGDSILARLAEQTTALEELKRKYSAGLEDPTRQANLEEPGIGSLTKGLTGLNVMGLPLGEVAVGTFGGVFASEIIEGFMAGQKTEIKGLVKLGGAVVVEMWGKKLIGKDAAHVVAFVLAVFGLSQVLPIDKWAKSAADMASGFLPGTIAVTGMDKRRDVISQSQRVASDYYAAAEGR